MLVSVVFLYPLLLGILYWKETFVLGMPEMVEVMKDQDKRDRRKQYIVWLHHLNLFQLLAEELIFLPTIQFNSLDLNGVSNIQIFQKPPTDQAQFVHAEHDSMRVCS